jgi:hypothetical protein
MPGFAEGDTEEDEATSDAHHSPEKARSLRSWAMREKTKNRVSGSNISDLEREPGLVPEICYCTTHIGFIVLSKTSKNNGILLKVTSRDASLRTNFSFCTSADLL